MRVGFNPNKDKSQERNVFSHHIVIPVYIPDQEGYFKDSFEILKLCLTSLFRTCHKKTYITIVNNGSSKLVIEYLDNLYNEKKIHELIHVTNIGYINAMLKGITGQNFDLITTADADVLFLEGWQEETYNVFENFSRAGAVCPTPSSRMLRTHTANLYWNFLFSKRMRFKTVINPDALRKFGTSIGHYDFYNEVQLRKHLTISNNNQLAVVGAGHFVVTYRADIFNVLKSRHTEYVLGGGSDDLFDIPVIEKGFWRLSTADNYTYHMGNVVEEWMYNEVSRLRPSKEESTFQLSSVQAESKLAYLIKNKIFGRFILNKKILRKFLIQKGLTPDEARIYL
ncbi:glycosyltransferase [Flavobacterium sp. JAS]|uniref:glycosyltransferase n=1 Tax=Flavobacterium sp. JAS TaxID=2897329 RepID=UPI001E4C4416|nr:glycosyltransferase [Flavobacterium sp. JAS]MCD0471092.1 glycosyltransferase [Flavobacterium sp. JAS]